MTDISSTVGDIASTGITLGFGLIALNALSNVSRRLTDDEYYKRLRERRMKRPQLKSKQKDFWEETFE